LKSQPTHVRFSWSKVSSCPSNRLVSIGSGSRPRPSPRTGDPVAAAAVGPAPLGRFGRWCDLQAAAGRVDQRACLARTRRGHCERGARRQPVVVMKSGDVPRRKSRRTSFWAMAGSWCDEIRGTWLAQARPRRLGVLTMHPLRFPESKCALGAVPQMRLATGHGAGRLGSGQHLLSLDCRKDAAMASRRSKSADRTAEAAARSRGVTGAARVASLPRLVPGFDPRGFEICGGPGYAGPNPCEPELEWCGADPP